MFDKYPSHDEQRKLLAVAELRAGEKLRDERDAQEAANTALKELLFLIQAGRGPRNRAGWITTCARRRAIDILRQRGQQGFFGGPWDDWEEPEDLDTPLRKLMTKEDRQTIELVMRCARSMFEPEEQEIFEYLMEGRAQASVVDELGAHDAVAQRVNAAVNEVAGDAYRFVTHTKPARDSQLYVVSCIESLNDLTLERLRNLVDRAVWVARDHEWESDWSATDENSHPLSVSHYLEWTLKDLGGRGQPSRSKIGRRRLLAGVSICVAHSLGEPSLDTWISDEIESFKPQSYGSLLTLLHAVRRSLKLEVADPLGSETPIFGRQDWRID